VSSAEQIEVQETAQPQEHRSARLPRFYFAGLLSVLGGLLLWELVSRFLVAPGRRLFQRHRAVIAPVAVLVMGTIDDHLGNSLSGARTDIRTAPPRYPPGRARL